MICHLQKPCGWWNAAAFHQPLLSLSPTKNVNYTIPPAGELQLTKLFYKNNFFVLYTN